MRYTLLDLTQKILASMDGDEINSITDTTEAQSIIQLIQTTYYDIAARANLPRHFGVFQLQASGDTTKPVTMTLPSTCSALNWIKYDWHTTANPEVTFMDVQPMENHEFATMVMSLNTTDTDVFSYTYTNVEGQTLTFLGKNTQGPRYYTTFNDNTVLFDSYDRTVDTTLQGSKTLCYGQRELPWTMSNTFVPDLDEKQFQLLFNEAKALAFAELKQMPNPKAEQTARKLWINQQSAKTRVPTQTAHQRGPYYGRK